MDLLSKKILDKQFDLILAMTVLCFMFLSLLLAFSSTYSLINNQIGPIFFKHCFWLSLGTFIILSSFSLSPSFFERQATLFYGFSVFLLICVLFLGKSAGGARRWLFFHGITLQPSEIMKIALIFFLASFFKNKMRDHHLTYGTLLQSIGITMVPFILTVLEPDLGTAVVFIIIWFIQAFIAGLSWGKIRVICILFILFLPAFWTCLKPYQKDRVLSFFKGHKDRLGAGWTVSQSRIAAGSGGLWGKGFLKGTQTHLYFISEKHTDFIFPVLAEEWGYIGVCGFVLLILIFLSRLFWLIEKLHDLFHVLSLSAIGMTLFFQWFVNMSMTMGFLPVTGLPMPLISYGGSSSLFFFISMSFVFSCSQYCYKFMIRAS